MSKHVDCRACGNTGRVATNSERISSNKYRDKPCPSCFLATWFDFEPPAEFGERSSRRWTSP